MSGYREVWSDAVAPGGFVCSICGMPVESEPCADHAPEAIEGCDCTELCSMGPTCPGGMLAGLPGSGCWRVNDHGHSEWHPFGWGGVTPQPTD